MRINQTSLNNLEGIYLGPNQIPNVPAFLDGLNSSILYLELTGNFIGKCNASIFQRFTKPESLYLRQTNLSEIVGNPLTQLHALDISDNNLKYLDAQALSSTLRQRA